MCGWPECSLTERPENGDKLRGGVGCPGGAVAGVRRPGGQWCADKARQWAGAVGSRAADVPPAGPRQQVAGETAGREQADQVGRQRRGVVGVRCRRAGSRVAVSAARRRQTHQRPGREQPQPHGKHHRSHRGLAGAESPAESTRSRVRWPTDILQHGVQRAYRERQGDQREEAGEQGPTAPTRHGDGAGNSRDGRDSGHLEQASADRRMRRTFSRLVSGTRSTPRSSSPRRHRHATYRPRRHGGAAARPVRR